MSRRFTPFAVGLVLVLAGCNHWQTVGFNAARTSSNPFENELRVENVAELQELWSAADGGTTPPIVSGDTVFVTSSPQLRSYSADGSIRCSGLPRVCQPLWSAVAPSSTPPTVANGVVYVAGFGSLSTFDAKGVKSCGGTPKVCAPMWTAALGIGPQAVGSPAVADGVVYVGADKLYAFDAAGSSGCSGAPKTCQPLWTAPGSEAATPSIANGVVYLATLADLFAYDAAGTTSCSGTPKTCAPLWSSHRTTDFCSGGCGFSGPPTISSGHIYVYETFCCAGGQSSSVMEMFDASGQQGCSGAPKTCVPLASVQAQTQVSFVLSPIAATNSTVYSGDLGLTAFSASGLAKLWESSVGVISSPTMANGVMFGVEAVSLSANELAVRPVAFDASGTVGCAGTPKECMPIWTGPEGPHTTDIFAVINASPVGPTVANGKVFVRTDRLRVYGLP